MRPSSEIQTQIFVSPDDGVTTPPSPTPTTTAPPVTPTGDLTTVGLLPLARGNGDDLSAFYVKVRYKKKKMCACVCVCCVLCASMHTTRGIATFSELRPYDQSVDPLRLPCASFFLPATRTGIIRLRGPVTLAPLIAQLGSTCSTTATSSKSRSVSGWHVRAFCDEGGSNFMVHCLLPLAVGCASNIRTPPSALGFSRGLC